MSYQVLHRADIAQPQLTGKQAPHVVKFLPHSLKGTSRGFGSQEYISIETTLGYAGLWSRSQPKKSKRVIAEGLGQGLDLKAFWKNRPFSMENWAISMDGIASTS